MLKEPEKLYARRSGTSSSPAPLQRRAGEGCRAKPRRSRPPVAKRGGVRTYREACNKKGGPLFIPFTVLGDPDKKKSIEVIRTLTMSGADALELGLPFSDPPADGPVIQAADARALQSGVRIDDCFDILQAVRLITDIPIGLLVYYNLVLQRGTEKFYADCAKAGVNSVLIADLPLEHAGEVVSIARRYCIAPVFLVSELTTEERMEKICAIADGYLYIVSYLGVTGDPDAILEKKIRTVISRARKYSGLPLFVGFGINTPKQARAAQSAGADGVIIGSRIVREIPDMKRIEKVCREFAKALPKNRSGLSGRAGRKPAPKDL